MEIGDGGAPLFQSLRESLRAIAKFPSLANAGLWYDKFCNQWNRAFDSMRGDRKRAWVATLASNLGGPGCVGEATLLDEFSARSKALQESVGGLTLELETASRFVPGLGNANPIEAGLRWHPTLGVPYIPGSTLKGAVRAWAQEQDEHETDVARVFGPEGRAAKAKAAVGTVIFLDALPTGAVTLEGDVMTPHYACYYQDAGGQVWPGDWEDPVPIPFLVVAAGQRYRFTVIPRTKDASDDCKRAARWLEHMLSDAGVGAKTAVGYGRFTRPAPVSLVSTARKAVPRYRAGDLVTAVRVEDPKGRGRPWFQADDGFGGVCGDAAKVETGQTIELEISNVNTPPGYNFRAPRSKDATERGSGKKRR
ncbi:MAG: type III-B CRISPR module RAMP protein Cmr6 [Vulcanimicrobiaceae bacterium]